MANYGLFSVSQFAKLSNTTRDILLNYDRLGLLSPVARGENNYRYYSSDQLAIVNMIRILLALGRPLAKIKRMKDRRDPESADEELSLMLRQLDEKIKDLTDTRKLAETIQKSIRSVRDIDEQAITVQSLPETAIVLGDVNDYSKGRHDYDTLFSFYADIADKYPDVNLNYSVWAMFPEDRIRRGDWTFPERYYFCNPDGADTRPAGQYAVGYARGGYGQTDELYKRMLAYIDQNNLEICGDTYEEYPLNEICVLDEKNYLIRVMITVRSKKGRGAARARRK